MHTTSNLFPGCSFPNLGNIFSKDRKAVDEEVERLKPLVDLGGYIPCPDHRIAPDAEWDLVRYYCDRMRSDFSA